MEKTVKEVAEMALPQVNQLASRLMDYLEAGMEVAKEQAPLFINEIISWGIFYGCFYAVFGLLLIVATIFGIWAMCKLAKKYEERTHDDVMWIPCGLFGLIFGLAGGVVGITTFIDNLLYAAKAYFAPRLFLVDYLSNLIN